MSILRLIKKYLAMLIAITGLFSSPVYAEDETLLVFGASGRVGEVIVEVALERGYKVLGVSRKPEKLTNKHSNFSAVYGDLMDVQSIKSLASGVDAIAISVSARASDNQPENSLLVHATKNVLAALNAMENKPYLLQVGGANLMYGSSAEELKANMPNAPFSYEEGTEMYAVVFGHQISVKMYEDSDIEWSVIAPPMRILGIYEDRDSTTSKETFRVSASGPLLDNQGNSMIYVRDLARAALDEIENKEFVRQVFTVAY